jgi:hypothetical protein
LLAAAPLEVVGSLRSGRREVLVLRARSGASGQNSTQPDSEPADLPGDSR